MTWVTFDVERGDLAGAYIRSLARRMERHGISQNSLAQMLGRNPSQVNRWFTKNRDRRVTPDMGTVDRIEEVLRDREEEAISHLEQFIQYEPETWTPLEREKAQSSLSILIAALRLLQEGPQE